MHGHKPKVIKNTEINNILTSEGLNEAISILEDKELSVKYIVLRGACFNDMRGWEWTRRLKRNYGSRV